MTDLRLVELKAAELGNNVETVIKAQKALASAKSRLKKQKFKSTYQAEMENLIAEEQILKEVKQLLQPKAKKVPDYDWSDIEILDYNQTLAAIKSIQSKKTLSQYLTQHIKDNVVYQRALEVEKMLLEHKKNIKPIDDSYVLKSEVQKIISTIEDSGELSQKSIIELLQSLL